LRLAKVAADTNEDATVQLLPAAATGPLASVKITGVAAAPARSMARRLIAAFATVGTGGPDHSLDWELS
jgi:glycerol uptake facilitator-like aquaporin